jgi:hypothetical protein
VGTVFPLDGVDGATRSGPALACGMSTGRSGPTAGVIGSAVVMVLGIAITLMAAGTDLAFFGWLLLVVGALGVVGNVVLGTWMR